MSVPARGRNWGKVALVACVVLSVTCAIASGLFAWNARQERGAALAMLQRVSEIPAPALPAPVHPEVATQLDRLTQRQEAAAALLAAITLEDVAASSAPFAGELAYAMNVAADDRELLAPLDRLMAWAEVGVPSRTELVARFPRAAAEAWAAGTARDGITDRATLLMRNAALQVGIGKLPSGDPAAVLDRARAALSNGQVDQALAQLAATPPTASRAITDWSRDAAARVEVEAALREFRQLAIARALR